MRTTIDSCRARGLTLIEVAVAMTLGAIVMVILGNILSSTTDSVDSIVVGSVGDQDLKKSLNRFLDEVQRSSTSRLDIDSSDPDHDVITLQTPSNVGGTVSWGAVDATGIWREDWSARYLVEDGRLVRKALNTGLYPVGSDEPFARGVDGLRDGRKGFLVTRNGTVINAAIRVVRSYRSGVDSVKEFDSSVMVRNG